MARQCFVIYSIWRENHHGEGIPTDQAFDPAARFLVAGKTPVSPRGMVLTYGCVAVNAGPGA